jgi:hypothetical protein
MIPPQAFETVKGPEMINQKGFEHDCKRCPYKVDGWSHVGHDSEATKGESVERRGGR